MKDKNIEISLQDKWNKKLEKSDLPEEIEPLKVPIMPVSAIETLKELDPNIESYLGELKALNKKFQNGILIDLRNKRKEGLPPAEIIERFKILVAKSQELENMTAADSDKEYKPRPPTNDKEAEESANRAVDELLRKIEEIVNGKKSEGDKKDGYVN